MITFAKLQELMTTRPVVFPGYPWVAAGVLLGLVGFSVLVVASPLVGFAAGLAGFGRAAGGLGVLPGGGANGDALRSDRDAIALVKSFATSGKPIAVICHGGWVLVDADVVRGRRITSWPTLQTDFRNAGAEWVDEELVVDRTGPGPLISSRKPDDLPAFCKELTQHLS